MAIAPFGQVSLRFEGSYFGRFQGGDTASMPLSPSTIVSLASAAVGAMSARRLHFPVSTRCLASSAPSRVLPYPRPARQSHTLQSPSGGSWFGLAHTSQSYSREAHSSSVRLWSTFFRLAALRESSDSSNEEVLCVSIDIDPTA